MDTEEQNLTESGVDSVELSAAETAAVAATKLDEPPAAPAAPTEQAPADASAKPAAKPVDLPANGAFTSEEQLPKKGLESGDIVDGKVLEMIEGYAVVDIGQKSEGLVPVNDMRQISQVKAVEIGDKVSAYVVHVEDTRLKVPILSLDRALSSGSWHKLEEYCNSGATAQGKIVDANRGGLIVTFEGLRGFVPLSHLGQPFRGQYSARDNTDISKVKENLIGEDIEFTILEFNRSRNHAIFSHRQVAKEQREQKKRELLATLEEGQVISGEVIGISDFGAFVDIGGVDGLIHISELSWEPVFHPSDIVEPGDKLEVCVYKIDRETQKIALSLKRMQPEPWSMLGDSLKEGDVTTGIITKIVNFGAFAKVVKGVEGLIHISELSYERVEHPGDIVSEGQELELKVCKIDLEAKRLALSLKAMKPNPKAEKAAAASSTDSSSDSDSDSSDSGDSAEVADAPADEPASEAPDAPAAEADASDAPADAEPVADAPAGEADAETPAVEADTEPTAEDSDPPNEENE